ncbi:MAG TPA: CBS domain-containing protein [Acidimicrobiia bacterium]
MPATVAQILAVKGRDVWSIPADTTVYKALQVMAERGVGALLVMDGERLVGIVSERDYARKVILLDRVSRRTAVSEIMTGDPQTVTPSNSVTDCMTLMTELRVRHLPVVEDDGVVGLISIGDVVKHVISEQESLIAQLEQYITG